MTTHTPGPWRYEKRGDGSVGIWAQNDTKVIGMTAGWESEFEEPTEANAEFIVRACNSHDELLEALHRTLALLPGRADWPAVVFARAAIAKATGSANPSD
jgi:hypothetical protein